MDKNNKSKSGKKSTNTWKKIAIGAFCAVLVLSVPVVLHLKNHKTVKNSNETSQTLVSSEAKEGAVAKNDGQSEETGYKYEKYASMSAEEIAASMTLEQKAGQMVMSALYNLSGEDLMVSNDYGSILSLEDALHYDEWQQTVDAIQQAAVKSESGIPFIYGQDDVHGVNYCANAVIFPHNIGMGAANDPELMYEVGLATADEAKLCRMLWNYAPCLAQSVDPRWGRTYESYGSDLEMIKSLGTAYTKGLLDGGIVACAKHYFGDGNVAYGSGEKIGIDMLMDRGDARLSDEEIEALLEVYKEQIDAGVQTIMISHSSLNGLKMHENKEYIMKLKNEMGFKGFIAGDWGSVENTSGSTYEEQVITAINAGIDMLMEVDHANEAMQIIIDAVNDGKIPEDRINDAVKRIIQVKLDQGLFDDPFCEKLETKQKETGSDEYRALAEKLVEKSLVLLKNENETLPLKNGTSVYITGPACDSGHVQCGGWTVAWNGSPEDDVEGVTTILDGFKERADEYGLNIITNKNEAENADVVLICVGEDAYSEWNGDTDDPSLYGDCALELNEFTIEKAKALGKPVVTCIVAGRNVILDEKDLDSWDSVVMCYLPGSEGQGVADVLCGKENFSGKLPSPWYASADQIGTDECMFKKGYGLEY